MRVVKTRPEFVRGDRIRVNHTVPYGLGMFAGREYTYEGFRLEDDHGAVTTYMLDSEHFFASEMDVIG